MDIYICTTEPYVKVFAASSLAKKKAARRVSFADLHGVCLIYEY